MTRVLDAEHLYKTFRARGKATEAVRDVSLHLDAGEVVAFLGPNGAGKTTTIKMIATLIRPDRGEVRILGENPHRHAWTLRHVGAVLEGNRNVYWRLTPPENLVYFGVLRGMHQQEAAVRAEELLARFDLTDKRKATVQTLSRGMQQKLAIAMALMQRPKLLLLDEPTLGLDVEAAQSVQLLIREIAAEGHAILLTTHQLEVAQRISDRVAIIRDGTIIAEERTQELLRRFSGQTYTIEVRGELTDAQIERLRGMQAEIDGGTVCYLGEPAGLWQVLDVLRPLPLVRVAPEEADLAEVFLKLVREGRDA